MKEFISYSPYIEQNIDTHMVTLCKKGRIFFFSEGRNAWNWSWSQTYPGDDAFSLTFEQSKQKIENRRIQGSTWWIEELPACVFSGTQYSLIVTEINTETPLRDYVNITFDNPTIGEIAEVFEPSTTNFIITFICNTTDIDVTTKTLKRYKSYSNGGNYALGWTPRADVRYKSNYVNKIVRMFSSISQGQ